VKGAAALLAAAALAGCGTTAAPAPEPAPPAAAPAASLPEPLQGEGTALSPLAVRLEARRDPLRVRFARPPRAGLLFDLDTGRVLWRRNPTRPQPIASLTKMMTALVAVERIPRRGRVRITRRALRYSGSGVGLLPRGRRIRIAAMLHGLLLVSGNDAARAIAEEAGGSIPRFVRLMNARAGSLGLGCTRFTSPDGLDGGNRSCAADLAALARAVLAQPRLARIVRRDHVVLPFQARGGVLELWNTNPLLRAGYRGTTGLKTGYTSAAGRCLVATARRGRVRLGAVLLDSPDPGLQARRLLDHGFRFIR
jgi:D-alanyl-D-alanine carboxypeptidase